MSKFNKSNVGKNKTKNRNGHQAYKMNDKEHLVTAVLTSMFGVQKYYGSTDNDVVQLSIQCAKEDPEFLMKLACYARNVGNMRSISHVLTAIIAREAHEYTRQTIKNVVVRPDDILEIMSCYKNFYGKPFPNAMKREIANVIQNFNEYSIAKYNGGNKELKFKDVLRIVHPTPNTKEVEELFNKVLNDNLETPYTWETELSAKGNTKEVWEELIKSDKVGYMALLRNLRNIINSGADVTPVLEKLADENEVRKSKQLPFRFYSAYREVKDNSKEVRYCLDKALSYSVDNLPILKGRTLIAVDVSGSMDGMISHRSKVKCNDIANTFACMSAKMCEDAVVAYFNSKYWGNDDKAALRIVRYGKYDSILDNIDKAPKASGGTDMSLPMKWALETDKSEKPFDRIIYISDNECNSQKGTVQSYIDRYRKAKNCDPWVHAIDLQGYGTQQFTGKKFNLITGWSDSVLEFIPLVEAGFEGIIQAIENYNLK